MRSVATRYDRVEYDLIRLDLSLIRIAPRVGDITPLPRLGCTIGKPLAGLSEESSKGRMRDLTHLLGPQSPEMGEISPALRKRAASRRGVPRRPRPRLPARPAVPHNTR